jgi:anthranilate phosphoribosyltransferase
MALLPFLHKAVTGATLSKQEAFDAMQAILSGEASPALIAAFLTALRMRGEDPAELAGFAAAMRHHAVPVPLPLREHPLLDTCGTGGDGAETFNISTVAAFVAAGAGVHVAKHGNRSVSSRCGSADVLEKLGIPMLDSPELAARAIQEVGIGFLFAPAFHPAMRHAMPVRRELRMRTVFNLLGPLANPANASCQLVGAPGLSEARMMASALADFGLTKCFVVHGSDGLDEVTTTGPTHVFELTGHQIREWVFEPAQLGVPLASAADLKGGNAEENAQIALAILGGESGPKADIVLVNAAFAIAAARPEIPLNAAFAAAQHAVTSGSALGRLNALREFLAGGRDHAPSA